MQTFLPYPDFYESIKILDRKRIGKQRVEAMQLINTINYIKNNDLYIIDKNGRKRKRGWLSHPATLMWLDYEDALKMYHDIAIKEWINRGYKNTMKLFNITKAKLPPWLGDDKIHSSHRSNLLRKDPIYYSQFGWKESPDMEYVWPKL